MFEQLLTAKSWLQEQAFIIKDWWLEQIIALKVWMIVSTLLGTALVSSLTTYGVIQLQQAQSKTIPVCPVPQPCPICIQQAKPAVFPSPKRPRWDFKPLQRDGRSY